MRRPSALAAGLLALAFLPSGIEGGETAVLVLREVRILTASRDGISAIPRGAVLLRDGKIAAVGESVAVPDGAEAMDLPGRWVLPGFIDAHSHLGIRGEADELTAAITEDLRLLDAFDPWDPEIELLLQRGVTAVALSPGDRNVVGGAVAVLKLAPGRLPVPVVGERVALKASVSRAVLGGPSFSRYPTATSGALNLLEDWLKGSRPAGGAPAAPPAEKALPVILRADNRSQAEEALALLEAAGRPAVLLAGRAFDARSLRLLEPRCPVIVGPLDLGDPRRLLGAPAALEKIRAPLAFAGSGERRDVLTTAVLALRGGLSREAALAALTEGPARILGLEGRIGRIAAGADADLVVWSGDPFSLSSAVEMAVVDGKIAWRAPAKAEPSRPAAEKAPAPAPAPSGRRKELAP